MQQLRLSFRRVVRAELRLAEHRRGNGDDRDGDPSSCDHRHQGNHAAISAASTCGKSATRTTIVADSARIASAPLARGALTLGAGQLNGADDE